MAHIVPSDITRLALAGAREPELETLRALRDELPGDYTVFHSVHWTREYRGRTAYGELDFVVVNRAGQALLVEQKNGPLEETDAGLFKLYDRRPKNVGEQVHRALDHVRDKFRRIARKSGPLELEYLVYCPDHRLARLRAAGLDESRIVHAGSSDRLCQRVAQLLPRGEAGHESRREQVLAFFRQDFDLVPDIHAHISGHERSFTRLSGGLVKLLDGLEMQPLRLRIRGTAGCGKTTIARHFYDGAVAGGRRPLFVCFNRPLAERVRNIVRPGGCVATFLGLCAEFLKERGHSLDFGAMRTDPAFWRRVQERVVEERVPAAWSFDTLVVDEGQDLEPEAAEVLRLFLSPDHGALWLEDPDQNVRGPGAVALPGFVGFRTRVNYRSPESIARFLQQTLPFEFEGANDLPGLGVGVHPFKDAAEQPALVGRIVGGLLSQGFTHDDIVILTTRHEATRGAERSVFGERAGPCRLRRFTGAYDLFGNQVTTPGQVTFDSVGRFKGQQSPAVILVDVDPDPGDAQADMLLFAGMTRASVRLDVVARRDNPANARFFR
ncbi:MAG: NERD domain-containing protein [Acidobacteria bacterium]|nr:NERD domain-containing protein [Acidobacteriota bacterium]